MKLRPGKTPSLQLGVKHSLRALILASIVFPFFLKKQIIITIIMLSFKLKSRISLLPNLPTQLFYKQGSIRIHHHSLQSTHSPVVLARWSNCWQIIYHQVIISTMGIVAVKVSDNVCKAHGPVMNVLEKSITPRLGVLFPNL